MTNRWPLGPKGWAVNERGKESEISLARRRTGFERVRSTQLKHSRGLRTKASCLTSKATGLRRRKHAVGLRTRQVYDGRTLSVSERDRSLYDGRKLSVFERDGSTTTEERCRSLNATGLSTTTEELGLSSNGSGLSTFPHELASLRKDNGLRTVSLEYCWGRGTLGRETVIDPGKLNRII